MKTSSLVLRRFGVSVAAVATIAAGLPVLLTSSASADHAPGHQASAPPGQPTPSDTATATIAPSASPSPTMTFTPPNCGRAAEVLLERSTITATGTTDVAVTADPRTAVELWAYTRPETTYELVRSGTTDQDGVAIFTPLRPPANTRLQARERGCPFGPSVVLNVRTQLSMNVVRNGTRDYTFSGNAIPARPFGLIISLYRVRLDGREILTAQARANANVGQPGYDASRPAGSYTIRRKFTGSGRFGFLVRTGQDLQNAPGRSNVRPTLIY